METLNTNKRPLIVDIDGTLLRGNLFLEGLVKIIARNPALLFVVLFDLILRGRAYVKAYVARKVSLDVSLLPMSHSMLNIIREKKMIGAPLILASGCNESLANEVGNIVGADKVFASNESLNLTGKNKLAVISQEYREFDYAGNSLADIPLWHKASQSYIVNAGIIAGYYTRRTMPDVLVVQDSAPLMKLQKLIKLIRVHHWLKNLLLFIALIVSHKIFHIHFTDIANLILGFLSFSFIASTIYIINDIFDLENDRKHSYKRKRALASGDISIPQSLIVIVILFLLSVFIAMMLSYNFRILLATYFILSLSYTFYLKRIVIMDVIVLSILYTLRVLTGVELISVEISTWFLAFIIFTFFSLSIIKRCVDIHTEKTATRAHGRGYHNKDYTILSIVGSASSMVAILIYCLYISSNDVSMYYSRPKLLWLGLPALLYYFPRLWLLTDRGEIHSDPLIFIIRDVPSYLIIGFMVVVIYFAV